MVTIGTGTRSGAVRALWTQVWHFVFLCVHVHLWVGREGGMVAGWAREHSWAGGARSILCRIGRDVRLRCIATWCSRRRLQVRSEATRFCHALLQVHSRGMAAETSTALQSLASAVAASGDGARAAAEAAEVAVRDALVQEIKSRPPKECFTPAALAAFKRKHIEMMKANEPKPPPPQPPPGITPPVGGGGVLPPSNPTCRSRLLLRVAARSRRLAPAPGSIPRPHGL